MIIKEVVENNWKSYKQKMLDLENKVKEDMVKKGIGDLFFTTGEDIYDYVTDSRHHVYIMINEQDEVLAQTYLIGPGSHIQGDYSDLPKYFTMDKNFINYIKKKYKKEKDFMHIAQCMYLAKLEAFEYALKNIYGTVDTKKFLLDMKSELLKETHFDERTKLRRNINKYMSDYMKYFKLDELYRQFYNIDSSFINYSEDKVAEVYDEFLKASKIKVYRENIENKEKYYEANINNTIEVDTYITDPSARKNGSAKILTTIALNKTIKEFFNNEKNDILYLSVTLHKDNYLSENVAHFLGFKDYIDLERRSSIERKVYMKKIDRKTYKKYISYLNKKIKYFYNFGDETVNDEEKELFEQEKNIHNEKIINEIDIRLQNEEFDNQTLEFINSIRQNINDDIIQKKLRR